MKTEHIIQLIGVLFVPIVGFGSAYFAYRFASRRDRKMKALEMNLPTIVSAYCEITRWISFCAKNNSEMVDAIHKLQLLGSGKVASLCNNFTHSAASGDKEVWGPALMDLLNGLRDELRETLGLGSASPSILLQWSKDGS